MQQQLPFAHHNAHIYLIKLFALWENLGIWQKNKGCKISLLFYSGPWWWSFWILY